MRHDWKKQAWHQRPFLPRNCKSSQKPHFLLVCMYSVIDSASLATWEA